MGHRGNRSRTAPNDKGRRSSPSHREGCQDNRGETRKYCNWRRVCVCVCVSVRENERGRVTRREGETRMTGERGGNMYEC
ncbi:hypothetical protein FKM82_001876 [Ascaphus truei]